MSKQDRLCSSRAIVARNDAANRARKAEPKPQPTRYKTRKRVSR